jgi:DNA uptake protein ComE-like DNA-binding protein
MIRVIFGILAAIAVICALSTAPVSIACEFPQIAAGAPAPEARVDINAASLEQLLKVPGMTHTWAVRIIRFRPYRAKNDLADRGVVSSKVYDRIKDYIIAHRSKL